MVYVRVLVVKLNFLFWKVVSTALTNLNLKDNHIGPLGAKAIAEAGGTGVREGHGRRGTGRGSALRRNLRVPAQEIHAGIDHRVGRTQRA